MKKVPKTFKYYGQDVMSNFDHEIDEAVEKAIKGKSYFADYPGWNFHSTVWWDKEVKKWCCEVMRYHIHVETVEADTLQEIMNVVSNKYGYE